MQVSAHCSTSQDMLLGVETKREAARRSMP